MQGSGASERARKKKSALGQSNSKATPKGLESLRAEPNGFLVHLLSHSDKVSVPGTICLFINSNGLFVPGVVVRFGVSSARVSNTRAAPQATKWPSPAIPPLRACFLLRVLVIHLFCCFFLFSCLWTSSVSLFCLHFSGFHFAGATEG